ncbi:MAG: hypothetical protein ACP5HU_00465 [Phycisphaerae bacterium]
MLTAAAVALGVQLALPVDTAVAQVYEGDEEGRIFAVPAQVGQESYGVFLVDTGNDTICVYEYSPARGSGPAKLRLTAARRFSFDLQLEEYNTEPPVREIRDLVEQHRRMDEASSDQ